VEDSSNHDYGLGGVVGGTQGIEMEVESEFLRREGGRGISGLERREKRLMVRGYVLELLGERLVSRLCLAVSLEGVQATV